jgi:hypothetical protein
MTNARKAKSRVCGDVLADALLEAFKIADTKTSIDASCCRIAAA